MAVQAAGEMAYDHKGPDGVVASALSIMQYGYERSMKEAEKADREDPSGDATAIMFGGMVETMTLGLRTDEERSWCILFNMAVAVMTAWAIHKDLESPMEAVNGEFAEALSVPVPPEARESILGQIEAHFTRREMQESGKSARDVVDELLRDVFKDEGKE
jgi:hypothetical protein